MHKQYNKSRQNAKSVIYTAKEEKQKEYASDLNNPRKYQNEIFFPIAIQMVKRHDMMGSNWLKGELDNVIVDEKGLKIHRRSTWENWWMK